MPKFKSFLAIGAGLVLAIALVSCGGAKKDSDSSGAASGAGTEINVSEAAMKISTLKSFRFNADLSVDIKGDLPTSSATGALGGDFSKLITNALKDVKLQGAVVSPDKLEVRAKLGGQEIGIVTLGDKSWSKFFGDWTVVDKDDALFQDGFELDDIATDTLPDGMLKAAKTSKEKVNGVETTRYSFDKSALQSLADDMDGNLDSGNMDVWISEDGIPVKISMKLAGSDSEGGKLSLNLNFNITDMNENITIKAPI